MKKLALIFPGQGAQYVGMGKDFAEAFSIARETFEEADEILGRNLSKIIFEGPEEELTQTKNSQPAIFVVSAAILRTLQSQMPGLMPFICSGLSLGEYTALWASGRLSFKEALLLVQKRAEFMNDACERTHGSMAAVLGLSGSEVEAAIRGIEGIWIANYNCPGQIVISGTREGVEAASAALKNAGAKRVLPLQVHGAFHSPLMASAQEGLTPFIGKAPIVDTPVRFAMNVPGGFAASLEEIRRNLAQQVTHSVRWEQGIRAIDATGVDAYLEIGCGKTLTGLNRKIGVAAPTISLEKLGELEVVVRQLEGISCRC